MHVLHPVTAPRERPILFSAQMVRAILADIKTQTRRTIKGDLDDEERLHVGMYHPTVIDRQGDEQPGPEVFGAWTTNGEWAMKCPYGRPGDRIWGKETFFAFGRWETRFSEKKGRDEWHFVDMTLECGHRYHYPVADDTLIVGAKGRGGATPMWWKRPAIFMPRVASRITLEVKAVKVERLQDISEADAMAEGIVNAGDGNGYQLADTSHYAGTASESYASLWESINGEGSWDANPHVWCVSFKRLEAA